MTSLISMENAKDIVECFYNAWLNLPETPSNEELTRNVSLFTPDCRENYRSMQGNMIVGREASMANLRANIKQWRIEEGRVLASSATPDTNDKGLVVFSEMTNRVNVMGMVLDPFYETSVIRVNNEGLIYEMKNFCSRSPVVWVTHFHTGKGPYSAEEMATAPEQMNNMDKVGCCYS